MESISETFEAIRGRLDLHIFIHFSPISIIIGRQTKTTAVLTIGGSMPGAITVDTTNETATVSFVDDRGNPTAEPTGASFTYASDNESVATVAADPNNPLQADITPVGLGTANISASSNGTALEADGATPIADPAPVQVTVSAGSAAGEAFALSA